MRETVCPSHAVKDHIFLSMLIIRNVGTTTSEIDRGIRVRDRWRVPQRAAGHLS